MIFEKHNSASGIERAYWNAKSLDALVDTAGMGIGIGSSRSSSWVISVVSQLGIIGTCMMGALVVCLLRGVRGPTSVLRLNDFALVQGARAAALSSLLTASIAGSGADPGPIFFIALAVLVTCQQAIDVKLRLSADPMRRPALVPAWGVPSRGPG
jgi:hypothetical protein